MRRGAGGTKKQRVYRAVRPSRPPADTLQGLDGRREIAEAARNAPVSHAPVCIFLRRVSPHPETSMSRTLAGRAWTSGGRVARGGGGWEASAHAGGSCGARLRRSRGRVRGRGGGRVPWPVPRRRSATAFRNGVPRRSSVAAFRDGVPQRSATAFRNGVPQRSSATVRDGIPRQSSATVAVAVAVSDFGLGARVPPRIRTHTRRCRCRCRCR